MVKVAVLDPLVDGLKMTRNVSEPFRPPTGGATVVGIDLTVKSLLLVEISVIVRGLFPVFSIVNSCWLVVPTTVDPGKA
jgi:hypothetical protein